MQLGLTQFGHRLNLCPKRHRLKSQLFQQEIFIHLWSHRGGGCSLTASGISRSGWQRGRHRNHQFGDTSDSALQHSRISSYCAADQYRTKEA
eukprot:14182548-Ditylum_brightwellii.AAC.1